MKVENLIKKLQSLPKGTEVCIMDWRKNLHHADDMPQGNGIHKDFEVNYETEDVNIPFAALAFENDDYENDGTPNYGASILNC